MCHKTRPGGSVRVAWVGGLSGALSLARSLPLHAAAPPAALAAQPAACGLGGFGSAAAVAKLAPATAQATSFAPEQAATTATGPVSAAMQQTQSVTEQRKQARMQGYEGENCNECGNFTLVRNGTCLKCNTCGSTTGCS